MLATARIFRPLPDDASVIVLRCVCDDHRAAGVVTGWFEKPYDGPLPCFLCAR